MPPRKADTAPGLVVLDGPLSLEQRQGYADTAVVGGLAAFVARQCSQVSEAQGDSGIRAACSDLTSLFADYGGLGPDERERRVAQAREILGGLGAATVPRQGAAPSTRRGRRRPSRSIDDPVTALWGVSEARARQLENLGIHTVLDLLQHYPLRHEDRRETDRIAELGEGQVATIKATVEAAGETHRRGRFRVTTVPVHDGLGMAELKWYGQDFRATQFDPGTEVFASGTVRYYRGTPQLDNPEIESAASRHVLSAGRIVPIYGLTKGLYMPQMRRLAHTAVRDYARLVPDIVPEDIRERRGLCGARLAIESIHFPDDEEALEQARHRITYEELFILQVQLARLRREAKAPEHGVTLRVDDGWLGELQGVLPFALTRAQQRVIGEIGEDLASREPGNRLLHGDVGSGKTAVAAWALLAAARNGYQAAYMVPTEVLAEQQHRVVGELLGPLDVEVALLIGGMGRGKKQVQQRIADGKVPVVVGTHALIQEAVEYERLGLAIIDEQHRFGVVQRAALREKGYNPNVLVMTATPIPRTLALTVYGDFDISVLDELPPGRQPPVTRVLGMQDGSEAYEFVRQEVVRGRQAFIVCPLVEESERLEVRAAKEVAQRLEREVLPDLRIGLVHGRMSTDEKDDVMRAFGRGQLDVLCATTVIEVGVNIPNASVMLVENAERFGLAQLHQLRGRVCRGEHVSHCLLLVGTRSRGAWQRVEVLGKTNDGFEIAEEDLKVRGPGEFYGTRQHGLPDLKMASVLADTPTLVEAREDALALIEADPGLRKPGHRMLGERIKHRVEERLRLVSVS
ncbi:MAG: ATP-dependent DNA helicase RecG [Armatimonadota bacterium]|jgi:ATP-dependent DNA helicase RecG